MTLPRSNDNNENEKSNSNEKHSETPEGSKEWGYDMYPERRNSNGAKGFMKGRTNVEKIRCERKVYNCIKENPIIKLMMNALRSSGCAVDIRRHFACEECSTTVSGGYDPVLNQVVICQNVAVKSGTIHTVLVHEMIHMFDYCRNELDFKNIDHLACTEIRAANLAHCSFMFAWLQGNASIFNIKEAHQNCVKTKAYESILAVRNVSKLEAFNAVERVFTRCYNDLEPIGRRIKRNSTDVYKAYAEGYLFGYD